MLKITKLLGFFIFPVFVILWNAIFVMTGLYDKFLWLDIPMHFIGGIAVAYSFLLTLDYLHREKYLKLNKLFLFIFSVSLASLFAVGWEFYEFLTQLFTGIIYQPSIADTMKDLFLGLLGGASASLIFILRRN
ncbi:MAG: hypothetical protein AABX93_00280 [Nanoarchaeota archaeon]|mgnify:CR=1 FL=1